jgi:formate hydrogenlyase subunit 6/NADH:ubiquinone oxidoreductase subunit I
VEDLPPTAETLISLYPEILRCVGCNTCRKVCPQEIEVMRYVAAAQRGDIARVADLSFDCLMCGLCASRCPAEIVPYHVAILARRPYSRHIAKPARHLADCVAGIQRGQCDSDLAAMAAADQATLKRLYNAREIEPENVESGAPE